MSVSLYLIPNLQVSKETLKNPNSNYFQLFYSFYNVYEVQLARARTPAAKTSLKIASCHGTLDNKEKVSCSNREFVAIILHPNDWIISHH